MANTTVVATALVFGPVNSASTAADISAAPTDTITAYVQVTANPSKLPFTVALEISPDGTAWAGAGTFKVAGSRTDLVHFSVKGLRASKARLRQNDANQGSNALKINGWISA